MDTERLYKYIEQVKEGRNNRPNPEFKEYSPVEMSQILDSIFETDSRLQLLQLADEDYKKVPAMPTLTKKIDIN
ncbi:MAG: hypothetical protein KJ578_03290 [Bacteroidetes bacterium]|nr:hypothetical protein [Bacteroidota bacterium]MBU1580968.1 hypothetical protein [Bacteroidota bacterium]MBU2556786.1 hypothetical protein [Bacteroidota bacterium]